MGSLISFCVVSIEHRNRLVRASDLCCIRGIDRRTERKNAPSSSGSSRRFSIIPHHSAVVDGSDEISMPIELYTHTRPAMFLIHSLRIT